MNKKVLQFQGEHAKVTSNLYPIMSDMDDICASWNFKVSALEQMERAVKTMIDNAGIQSIRLKWNESELWDYFMNNLHPDQSPHCFSLTGADEESGSYIIDIRYEPGYDDEGTYLDIDAKIWKPDGDVIYGLKPDSWEWTPVPDEQAEIFKLSQENTGERASLQELAEYLEMPLRWFTTDITRPVLQVNEKLIQLYSQ